MGKNAQRRRMLKQAEKFLRGLDSGRRMSLQYGMLLERRREDGQPVPNRAERRRPRD